MSSKSYFGQPLCQEIISNHCVRVALGFKIVFKAGVIEHASAVAGRWKNNSNSASQQKRNAHDIWRGKYKMGKSCSCTSSLRDLLYEVGIHEVSSCSPGQYRLTCPMCDGGSTREKSLSLKIDDDGSFAVYNCYRAKCGWSGSLGQSSSFNKYSQDTSFPQASSLANGNGESSSASDFWTRGSTRAAQHPPLAPKAKPPKVDTSKFKELDEKILDFFLARGISKPTLDRNRIRQILSFLPNEKEFGTAVVFPYYKDGEIVNCKYRGPGKNFWQVKSGEKVLYGLDDIKGQSTIYIVEGEMDKLAMEECGILNCVSVPDGAPNPKKSSAEKKDILEKKFDYLWSCRDYFEGVTRVILATDSDEPGQYLAEELARRLGRERCWKVKWPALEDGTPCKDANEVLCEFGPQPLRDALKSAEPFPIKGLFRFRQYFDEIDLYYNDPGVLERGVPTGWRSLEGLYRVVPGELTVVTGVPNSGKSEWIDALVCNLCASENWSFALCSMENKVVDHARKLIEKYTGKPFFTTSHMSKTAERMSPAELTAGKQWLDEHFHMIRCERDELPSIDWLLELARAAVLRHGIRGLVIDPYNELDHHRKDKQTETEYVSQMLTKVKRFAQHHDCHVWFVAHPKQLQQWRGDAPGLYDIAGSAHFVNKCDNGIVVHRNRDPDQGPLDHVQILVRKVRNKTAGTIGETVLRYDWLTGTYHDLGPTGSN